MKSQLRTSLSHMLGIVLFGMAAGLAGNQISPRGLPLITPPKPVIKAESFLAIDQAKQLWLQGTALFLDAREPADYEAGHIGNSLNLPALSFERHFGEIAPMLTPDSRLVLYCDGPECDQSHRLRESLRQVGYTNTYLMSNGWTTWRQAGLPITKGGRQ